MIVEIRDEVVALSGHLHRNRWPALKSAVNVRLRHHPNGIVVDCGGLEEITSDGATTFRDAAAHIAASGARIVVANVPPPVMEVLRQIPNLRSQLPLSDTVAHARASLGMPDRIAATGRPDQYDVLAVLLGEPSDADAVALAVRLAQRQEKPPVLYLTYVLVVPRNVPLLSAIGPEEEEARRQLEGLENAARRVLGPTTGVVLKRLERTREAAHRLLEVTTETNADVLVMAQSGPASDERRRLLSLLLTRAGCEVVINRLPPTVPTREEDRELSAVPRGKLS